MSKISETEKLVSQLRDAYETGYKRQPDFADSASARIAGQRIQARVDSKIEGVERLSVQDSIEFAGAYGRLEKIATQLSIRSQQLCCRNRFGQILSRVVVPNRDEARLAASETLAAVGQEYLRAGDKTSAAIEFTNSALQIIEMSNSSRSQLSEAAKQLEWTRKLRAKGSLDLAYSEFNLEIAKRQLLRFEEVKDARKAYVPLLSTLNRAHKIFAEHGDSIHYPVYLREQIEVLIDWIDRAEGNEYRKQCESEPNLSRLAEGRFIDSEDSIARAITSNPQAFGFDEVPEWVPSAKGVMEKVLSEIPEIEAVLSDLRRFFESPGNVNPELSAKEYMLRSRIAAVHGEPKDPFGAFEDCWEQHDYESYFLKAKHFLERGFLEKQCSDEYAQLLTRLAICVETLLRSWKEYDIERLLKRNTATFRFAACELMSLGLWERAYRLLEVTRGVVATGLYSDIVRVDAQYEAEDFALIHVTHSPKATYAVARRGVRYFGVEFEALNGELLAALFVGLSPLGLLAAQRENDRKATSEAANKIHKELADLGDWINGLNEENIVIMAGGLYQSFPIWTCGELVNSVLNGSKNVYHSTSERVAMFVNAKPHATAEQLHLSIQDAADVPGMSLSIGRSEGSFLTSLAPESIAVSLEDATRSSFLDSLSRVDALHFTGHSVADPNSNNSHLITHGGPVTVTDILASPVDLKFAFLGSCQSALTYGFDQQDEVLSIQTALWYRGCRGVIGTFWPIADTAGFAFSAKFYQCLFSKPDRTFGVRELAEAWRVAIGWMRNARRAEVLELIRDKVDVHRFSGDLEDFAFGFYDWAPFQLLGLPEFPSPNPPPVARS